MYTECVKSLQHILQTVFYTVLLEMISEKNDQKLLSFSYSAKDRV